MQQKHLYMQKLAADFEVMRRLIERRHVELKDKIEQVYDSHLRTAYRYIDGLSSIKQVIQSVEAQQIELKFDIDQLSLNQKLESMLHEIKADFDFDIQKGDLDLLDSRFINEPFRKLEKCLLRYDFAPIKHKQLETLAKQFVMGGSRIIEPKHVTTDFLLQIMPEMDNQKCLNVGLLY